MASRSIDDLEPATRERARAFLESCADAGLHVIVTCTLRSDAEQAALYARGRTEPGSIVTWARPGESLHQHGRALDVVPLRAGRPVWGTTGDDLALWRQVGDLGERAGLEWAGRWPAKRREFPHFQFKG